MRKMKKLLSMLLTVIMVLAMAAPSFAAEVPTTGTITVSNAKPGHTYNAYKIFNLTMISDGEGYAYTLTDEWKEFFTTGEGKNFVKLQEPTQEREKVLLPLKMAITKILRLVII